MRFRLTAHAVCALLSALPLAALPVFDVQAIGPAGFPSFATAINATGAVVGNYTLPDGTFRAFLYQDGQVTTLALPANAVQTWATAISNNGQAGGYTDLLLSPQGLVWDSDGNAVATPGAYVMGLNGAGDAAGMAIGPDGAGYAFVTRNGVLTSLGQPAGGPWSSAYAISSNGIAVGAAMNGSVRFTAFSASPNGATTLLNGLGGANSYARAVNAAGAVAGQAQTASSALQAVIWSGSNPTALGSLGGANSSAYAIDSQGHVAGTADLANNAGTAAFLYTGGNMYDLNALLLPNSGWQLLAAYGMNDAGQIVGRGLYNGAEQAFLLTPQTPSFEPAAAPAEVPEPATFFLIGVPLLGLLAIRSGSRSR